MKIRCYWHIIIGSILPWMPLGVNLGGILLFLGYEVLQFRYRSKREMKDDSYLDVREVAVAYAISAGVMTILRAVGVFL